jgi:hypothetical protein
VVLYAPAEGVACRVEPHAVRPQAGEAVGTVAALFVQLLPWPPGPASVASSFTVTDVGWVPVSVFVKRSRFTPRFTVSLGVTRHEQQEISSSPGSKAYTFTQTFPAGAPNPGPSNGAPSVPGLAISMYDSPMFRLVA